MLTEGNRGAQATLRCTFIETALHAATDPFNAEPEKVCCLMVWISFLHVQKTFHRNGPPQEVRWSYLTFTLSKCSLSWYSFYSRARTTGDHQWNQDLDSVQEVGFSTWTFPRWEGLLVFEESKLDWWKRLIKKHCNCEGVPLVVFGWSGFVSSLF